MTDYEVYAVKTAFEQVPILRRYFQTMQRTYGILALSRITCIKHETLLKNEIEIMSIAENENETST